MTKTKTLISRFLTDESGASAAEYALILASADMLAQMGVRSEGG